MTANDDGLTAMRTMSLDLAAAGTSTTLAELYAKVAGRRTDTKTALAAGFTPGQG